MNFNENWKTELPNKDESAKKNHEVLKLEVKFELNINGVLEEIADCCWHFHCSGDSRYESCLHQGIEKNLALYQSHTTRRQALFELHLITFF